MSQSDDHKEIYFKLRDNLTVFQESGSKRMCLSTYWYLADEPYIVVR